MSNNGNKDVLIVYQAPWNWDFLWNRAQPLAMELAKRAAVIYLDSGLRGVPNQWAFLRHVPKAQRISRIFDLGISRQIAPNLYRYIQYSIETDPWGMLFQDRSALGLRRLAQYIKKMAGPNRQIWLLNSRPFFSSLLDLVNWDKVIVDIEDPWHELEYTPPDLEQKIRCLLERADVIFSNGKKIARAFREFTDKPIESLPNGISESFVEQVNGDSLLCPQWMRSKSGKRKIVYTGHINNRMDFAMIKNLAKKFRSAEFIFVGLENPPESAKKEWEEFKSLENAIFHREIEHDKIPGILSHADILWMPHVYLGAPDMFPAKLFEYLAAGKWILSSADFSEEIGTLPGILYCPDFDAYCEALEKLLSGPADLDPESKRIHRFTALNNCWASRAEIFFQKVEKKEPVSAG